MKNKKIPVLSIVLYVLAALLAVFSVWAFMVITESLVQQQISFSTQGFNIIYSYMSSAGLYLVLAVILFSLGWIYQQLAPQPVKTELKPEEQAPYETVSVDPAGDVYPDEKTAKNNDAATGGESSAQ